jgi:hypothetical protein
VSVAAESASAVGADVDGGRVVVVVVGGTDVVGVVVVVGGTVVVVGVGVVPDWSSVFTGTIGGAYPQPDSTMVLETLIVEITFGPLFTRS